MAGRGPQDIPLVPGSDGAGIIVAIGESVRGFTIGDEVIIHPTLGWEHASERPIVPNIVGGPTDGTLAQYITLPAQKMPCLASPPILGGSRWAVPFSADGLIAPYLLAVY